MHVYTQDAIECTNTHTHTLTHSLGHQSAIQTVPRTPSVCIASLYTNVKTYLTDQAIFEFTRTLHASSI